MPKQTSAKISAKAGRIMSYASMPGGPAWSRDYIDLIRKAFPENGDEAIRKIAEIFKPYFDDAESVAASALSQDETPGQSANR